MNVGVILELWVDDEVKTVQWSAVCPSGAGLQPVEIMYDLQNWLEEQFHNDYRQVNIPIEKSKRIKARRNISQAEFNRRIAELGK